MLIRQATPDDNEGVQAVSTACGRKNWGPDVFLAAPERFVVIAETKGRLVGAAKTHFHAQPDGDAPAGHYLGGVLVLPSHRHRGVASTLTQARLEWIWSHSDSAYYFANEHNCASIQLHEAFGFRLLGRFPAIHGVTADNGRSQLVLFAGSRGGGPQWEPPIGTTV